MRIIAGKFKSRQIRAPKNLPARPTTDRTKESLFNILHNYMDFEGITVLDLFCGTGNISLECISRGASLVYSVDSHNGSIRFLKKIMNEWQVSSASKTFSMDAKKFLQTIDQQFELIFMDPPYDMPDQHQLIELILHRKLLTDDGILILEHRTGTDYSELENFQFIRSYGDSSLSFFFSD